MTALNRMLFRELRQLRGQVIAVALVVACGVATFVALRSVYDSLVVSRAMYYERYGFADVFATLRRAPEPLAARIAAIPGVERVETRVVAEVTLDVPGLLEPAVGRLVSVPTDRRPALNDVHIRQGRYIEPMARDEILASEAFAEANGLVVGDSIGAVVGGRWRTLRIVGIALSPEYIYEIRGAGQVFPDNRRFGVLWVGREDVDASLDMGGAFNDVVLGLSPGASEPVVVAALDRILEPYGGFGAHGRDDQISHTFLDSEITQNRVTSFLVPLIFLGVTAFLLHVLLNRMVATQRHRIAVMKAFGYSDRAVGAHYFLFALAAVAVGALPGIGIGVWLGTALTDLYGEYYRFAVLEYRVGLAVVLGALALYATAAFAGATSAVRRAVRLPPAEAMRPPAPARFRRGLAERLRVLRLLSPSSRITIRNLERRPGRALISLLGIALAISILVLGRFFFDAVDLLADLQFRVAMRDDIAVVFEGPVPERARHDLARLPGVLQVEPFRAAPVRLRHGHRSYRTALDGRVPDAQLRRIVDEDARVIGVPDEGLLLTANLGRILDARAGDAITVEFLEGDRRVRTVRVAALVEELVGAGSYMSLPGLHRLLGERTLSGAYLAVDGRWRDELYAELKELPVVSAVVIREAVVQGFEETIAESFRISTITLVIFASVIAFGIVYTGARIALSERGTELGTLSILGFSRGEVARVLLGEQALLTMLAVPVGFLMGWIFAGLVIRAAESDLFRFPLVISATTYAFAFIVVAAAALISGLAVRRRLERQDPLEVLKGGE